MLTVCSIEQMRKKKNKDVNELLHANINIDIKISSEKDIRHRHASVIDQTIIWQTIEGMIVFKLIYHDHNSQEKIRKKTFI